MEYQLSASDLFKLNLSCLPKTRESIARKAKQEEWPFKEVKGKGGRGGLKRVFKLPDYVLNEIYYLQAHPLNTTESKEPFQNYQLVQKSLTTALLDEFIAEYKQWRQLVTLKYIIPVRIFSPEKILQSYNKKSRKEKTEFIPLNPKLITDTLLKNTEYLVAFQERGDSMLPTIKPNSLVIFDTSKNQYEGEGIYLIKQGQEYKIKRLQKATISKLLIISDQSTIYPVVELDLLSTNTNEFCILGKYLFDCGATK